MDKQTPHNNNIYTKIDRCLKGHLVNGLSNDGMIEEIIFKLISISDTNVVMSEHV